METSVEARIPQQLAIQAETLVRDGWAPDLNSLVTEALRRYLESRRPQLTEAFFREDVQWGLHGDE
jgi:hypothetical protein